MITSSLSLQDVFFIRSLGFQWELVVPHRPLSLLLWKWVFRQYGKKWPQKTWWVIQSVLPIHRWFDCFQQWEVWGLCQRDLSSQLTVEKANSSDELTNYLDFIFIKGSNNRLYTKLYDKHDYFDFHVVNFPFLSRNIPCSHSYGVIFRSW